MLVVLASFAWEGLPTAYTKTLGSSVTLAWAEAPSGGEPAVSETASDVVPTQAPSPQEEPAENEAQAQGDAVGTEVQIRSRLCDSVTMIHLAQADAHALLVDTVAYRGLEPGRTYTCVAQIASVLDDPKAEPVFAEARASFTPEQPEGAVALTFALDTSTWAGRQLQSSEKLFCAAESEGADPLLCAESKGPASQRTVRIVELDGTLATASESTLSHTHGPQLTDTLSYQGLEPNHVYEARVSFLASPAEGSSAQPLVDDEGTPITVHRELVPEKSSGTIELACDAHTLADVEGQLLVQEELYEDDVCVATYTRVVDDQMRASVASALRSSSLSVGQNAGLPDSTPLVLAIAVVGLGATGALLVLWRRIRDVPYAMRRRRRHYVS